MPPLAVPEATSCVELIGGDAGDERGRIVGHGPQPGHIGQEHQLLCFDRRGQVTGDGVGVDVEGLPGLVGPDGGDHRDQALGQQLVHDHRVHIDHVTDKAQCLGPGLGRDQVGILARQAHGQCPVHVDGAARSPG